MTSKMSWTMYRISIITAIILLCLFCKAEVNALDISEVLLQVGTTNVVFIAQKNFLPVVAEFSRKVSDKHTVTLYTPERATKLLPKGSCNKRPNLELKKPKTILTLVHNLTLAKSLLGTFQSTITNCTTMIDPGLYSSENTFLFLALFNNITSELLNLYFDDKEVRRHPKAFGLYSLSAATMAVLRYNIYSDKIEKAAFAPQEKCESHIMSSAFHREFLMENYTFKVTTLPYDVYMTGKYLTEFNNPKKGITFTGGVEIIMINEICKRLECSIDYYNPVDYTWGQGETSTKNISGFYKDLYEEKAHFAMSAIGPETNRINMARVTNHMEIVSWVYTLVTPSPRPKSRFWGVLRPFTPSLWILLLLTTLVFSIILYKIANYEESLTKTKLSNLSLYLESLWYSWATLSQEHVQEFVSYGQHSYAMMIACSVWLLGIFVVTASYSGALRAFLISPEVEDPIDTFKQLVESSLTWSLVIYGEQVEEIIEMDPDPSLQKFWKNKETVGHEDFPYQRFKSIYLRKSATSEHGPIIATTIATAFTLPNGKRLVHVAKSANMIDGLYTSWPFHPLNPWFDRINWYVQSMVETGLRQRMEETTRFELGQKYLADLRAKGEITPVEIEMQKIEGDVKVINMEDLIGVFSLLIAIYAVLILISTITAIMGFLMDCLTLLLQSTFVL